MQQNAYKGTPERPWIRVVLRAPSGDSREFDLVADTGSPFAIIVNSEVSEQFRHHVGPSVQTNFGSLFGVYLRVVIPETVVDQIVFGYAADSVADAVRASSTDFQGLVGLPLLRMLHYGGDAEYFWVR